MGAAIKRGSGEVKIMCPIKSSTQLEIWNRRSLIAIQYLQELDCNRASKERKKKNTVTSTEIALKSSNN